MEVEMASCCPLSVSFADSSPPRGEPRHNKKVFPREESFREEVSRWMEVDATSCCPLSASLRIGTSPQGARQGEKCLPRGRNLGYLILPRRHGVQHHAGSVTLGARRWQRVAVPTAIYVWRNCLGLLPLGRRCFVPKS